MFDIPSNAVSNLIKLQNCLVKRGKHLDLEGECSQPTGWVSRVGVEASGNLGPSQTLGEGLPDGQMGWEGEGSVRQSFQF